MALTALSAIAPSLNLLLTDRIAKQFRTDSALLHLLDMRRGSGENNVWTVKFDARSAGGAYAAGADFGASEFDTHTRVQASNAWANYRTGVHVADETLDIVAATGGAEGMDLLMEEITDAENKLRNDVAGALYSGSAAASPVEVDGAARVIDATGTVCGIAPGSYADWAASEGTVATLSLTQKVLNDELIRPVKDAKGRNPDFVTVPSDKWDTVAAVLEEDATAVNEIRFSDGTTVDIRVAVGAQALVHKGVPYIEDRHCTAGTLYSWTRDDVHIRYVPVTERNQTPAEMASYLSSLTGKNITDDQVVARLRAAQASWRPTLVEAGKAGTSTRLALRTGNFQLRWMSRHGFAKLALT